MASLSEMLRKGIASIIDRQLDKGLDHRRLGLVFGLEQPRRHLDCQQALVMELPPAYLGQRMRRLAMWSVVVLAVACLAYGALWWLASIRFRDATLTWIEHRGAEGYKISHAPTETDGFPAVVRVILGDPTIASNHSRGSWSWSGPEVVVEFSPIDPEKVTIRLAGDHRLRHAFDGRLFYYEGSASELTIEAAAGGRLPVGKIAIRDLHLRPIESGDGVAAKRIDIETRSDPEAIAEDRLETYELDLKAARVELPRELDLPLGGDVTRLALAAKLNGALDAGPWPGALERWRDAGGTLEFAALELLYGPLSLSADGTLELDQDNQPIGAFNARIVGASRTVDVLHQRGLIEDMNAVAAKVAFAFMARKPPEGGKPVVAVPLTLHERTLRAGPVTLAVLPEIRWQTEMP